MINRTLIRLKVFQMLYSYLLTRSEFRLLPQPEKQSRDNRAAYALYLDFVLLILELSGYIVNADRRDPMKGIVTREKLSGTKLAKSLSADSDVREIIARGNTSIAIFDSILPSLYRKIADSETFADYSKKKNAEIADDVKFWSVIAETVFAKDPEVINAARSMENFTQVGFDHAIKMVCETLNNYSDSKTMINNAKRQLETALDKSYELYHALLLLCVELTREQERRINDAKEKFIPTAEELNPNMRFVNNSMISALAESEQMADYLKSTPISWEADVYLLRTLLDQITASDAYKEYMAAESTSFEADCELWRTLLKNIILPSDALADSLEAKSIYWNDDLEIMGTFVLKTIRQWAAAGNSTPGLLPMFKDDEDATFGQKLFSDAMANREEYRGYIDRFINSDQWDPERIAFMDIVLMTTMIAELINFPLIPVPVTFNEYIEIANRYSTAKSGTFINGVMYNVVKTLKNEGKIAK